MSLSQAEYDDKKAARIMRLDKRIQTLRAFAKGKDLSLFGEEKSGIPMGQPILVGHHSERRHRRHLERIERLVRAGYDAAAKADRLEERLKSIASTKAIGIDNPSAGSLLAQKLKRLETNREKYKRTNQLVRQSKGDVARLTELLMNDTFLGPMLDPRATAIALLKPDFAGRIGVPDYVLSNLGAEIRRLKKRVEAVAVVQEGFEGFTVGDISVTYEAGQVQVEFPGKPSEASRKALKGLALKWSSYSKRWVRKHTASTGAYFRAELQRVLEAVTYDL